MNIYKYLSYTIHYRYLLSSIALNSLPLSTTISSPIARLSTLRYPSPFTVASFRAGYLIHESAVWSSEHQQWFMAPRRASRQTYTEHEDERRAANILFRANAAFTTIEVHRPLLPPLPSLPPAPPRPHPT